MTPSTRLEHGAIPIPEQGLFVLPAPPKRTAMAAMAAMAAISSALALALFVSACTSGRGAPSSQTLPTTPAASTAALAKSPATLPLISYCELVHEPVRYLGKEVRVVGVFRVGFEWSQLYSTRCPGVYTTWVEGGLAECAPHVGTPEEEARHEEESNLRLEFQGATFGVVVRGALYGGDGRGYGHMDAFTFELVPECAEDMQWLDGRSYVESALTPDMRKKIDRYLKQHEPTAGFNDVPLVSCKDAGREISLAKGPQSVVVRTDAESQCPVEISGIEEAGGTVPPGTTFFRHLETVERGGSLRLSCGDGTETRCKYAYAAFVPAKGGNEIDAQYVKAKGKDARRTLDLAGGRYRVTVIVDADSDDDVTVAGVPGSGDQTVAKGKKKAFQDFDVAAGSVVEITIRCGTEDRTCGYILRLDTT